MISKFLINTSWMLLMIAVSGLVYIRLAPQDAASVHIAPPTGATPDAPVIKQGSALFVADYNAKPDQIWQHLSETITTTPRTRVVAGDSNEGMITYVTRSLVFGFPDYTTITVTPNGQGSRITLFGRLRFGRSDFGVNAARIRGWLQVLEALKQAG